MGAGNDAADTTSPTGDTSNSPEMTMETQAALSDSAVTATTEHGFDNLPDKKGIGFEQTHAPAPRGMGHGGMTMPENRQAEAECVDCCGECCSGICTLGCAVGVAACCESCDCGGCC